MYLYYVPHLDTFGFSVSEKYVCILAPHLLIIFLKWICASMSADNTACSIFEISLICFPKIAKNVI